VVSRAGRVTGLSVETLNPKSPLRQEKIARLGRNAPRSLALSHHRASAHQTSPTRPRHHQASGVGGMRVEPLAGPSCGAARSPRPPSATRLASVQ